MEVILCMYTGPYKEEGTNGAPHFAQKISVLIPREMSRNWGKIQNFRKMHNPRAQILHPLWKVLRTGLLYFYAL